MLYYLSLAEPRGIGNVRPSGQRSISRKAAWLLVPYILWVTVAADLNLGVFILN